MATTRWAGCNCGKLRLELTGPPIRTGLCHCLTCRKETGSPFMAFAIWYASNVRFSGRSASWAQSTDHRHFCPDCGSSVFSTNDANAEIEVRIGALDDAPSGLDPQYELWTDRREAWLPPVAGAAQHHRNRNAS